MRFCLAGSPDHLAANLCRSYGYKCPQSLNNICDPTCHPPCPDAISSRPRLLLSSAVGGVTGDALAPLLLQSRSVSRRVARFSRFSASGQNLAACRLMVAACRLMIGRKRVVPQTCRSMRNRFHEAFSATVMSFFAVFLAAPPRCARGRLRFHGAIASFVLCLAVLTSTVCAQVSISGGVRGRVIDPTDKPVMGAKSNLVSTATNSSQTAVTGIDGSYGFGRVAPGVYSVRAEQSGFRTVVHKNVQ
jgi:hypothetical protein